MKALLGIAALAAFAATMGAHAPAHATIITTQAGSICKPYGMNAAGSFFATAISLTNNGTATGEVLCPVIRTEEAGANGLKIYLDGVVPAGGTTTCWLMSYSYQGDPIGSVAAIIHGPVTFDQQLVLPQAQVPQWSSQVVDCALPPGGSLLDVEPYVD